MVTTHSTNQNREPKQQHNESQMLEEGPRKIMTKTKCDDPNEVKNYSEKNSHGNDWKIMTKYFEQIKR